MRMHEHERAIFTLLFFRAFIICHAFFFFLGLFKVFCFGLSYSIATLPVSTAMYGHLIYVVLADCVRELSSSMAWFEVSTRD